MSEKIMSVNLDANETAFFSRELEFVKARSYDKKYADVRYSMFLPVSTEANSGADSVTFSSYDMVGMAKVISNYADDLPRCDAFGTQTTVKVRGVGDAYGYNLQEIRASQMANKGLDQKKANAARRGVEQKLNNLAWLANGVDGIYGLIRNTNITSHAAPTGTWSGADPDEILADMFYAVDTVTTSTNGVEIPNTLLMPLAQHSLISTLPLQAGSDTTVLEFFRKQRPMVRIDWLQELKDVTTAPVSGSTKDCILAYTNDADHLSLEMPQAFEQLPAQERNMEFVINCHARCAGVLVYYPASVHLVEGI
jgi:hypothetical protein